MIDVRCHLLADCAAITRMRRQRPHIRIGDSSSNLAKERELTPTGWVRVLSVEFSPLGSCTFEILGGEGDVRSGEELASALRSAFPRAMGHNPARMTSRKNCSHSSRVRRFLGRRLANLHIARSLQKPTRSFWGPPRRSASCGIWSRRATACIITSLSARLARTCTFGRHVVATTFACSASATPREAANARRNGSFHEAQKDKSA